MHYTTLKINEIAIEYFSDNNSKFAKAMGTSEANIRNYRNGTLPKIDFIIKLCKNIEISFEWLLLDTGKKNASFFKDTKKSDNIGEIGEEKTPKVVIVDVLGNNVVALVSKDEFIDYAENYNNAKFIKKLKIFNLPHLNKGTYRMFQLDGLDMYPALCDGDFVVGEWVKDWTKEIKDDKVYIIISFSHGIVIKRVLNRLEKFGDIYCKSENRKVISDVMINMKDIVEVWEYKMHISCELPNPLDLEDRINDLEDRMMFLEGKRLDK